MPGTKFIVVSAQGGYICGVQTDNQVSCLTTIMGVEAPEELVLPEDENSDFIDADFHIGSSISYACGVKTSGQFSAGESLARMNTSPCRQIIPASSESVPAKFTLRGKRGRERRLLGA